MVYRQHEHFGHGRESIFRKGDFKYVILDLVKDKPRYGYEIIRELEERFQGFYAPSPGIVYPTLQYLEELGHVTAELREGKKVYTITEEGRRFLEEKKDIHDEIRDNMKRWWESSMRHEFRELWHETKRLGGLVRQYGRKLSKEKLRQASEVMSKASRDIEEILSK
jgi:DNA-binding PadR family transcriptional regulator